MKRKKEKDSETAETSFIEGDTFRVLLANKNAWDALKVFFLMQRLQNLRLPIAKREVAGKDVWTR